MHTTTGGKKKDVRSGGQESVGCPARRGALFDGDVVHVCAFVPACVYFWDKELCKHEFTNRGRENIIAPDPGLGQVTQSGTSLAQSFLLVTLQLTSTSMRYDRYDTVRFPRTDTQLGRCANRPRVHSFLASRNFPTFSRERERGGDREGERRKEEEKEKKERKKKKNVKNVTEETRSERIDRNEQRESFSSP